MHLSVHASEKIQHETYCASWAGNCMRRNAIRVKTSIRRHSARVSSEKCKWKAYSAMEREKTENPSENCRKKTNENTRGSDEFAERNTKNTKHKPNRAPTSQSATASKRNLTALFVSHFLVPMSHSHSLFSSHCSLCMRRRASAKAAGAVDRSARNCAVSASARSVSHHASKAAACAWNQRTRAVRGRGMRGRMRTG